MSKRVHCYLRTLRREWGLTQQELASLLPRGDRNRVSRVERGMDQPNAEEILSYRMIFGLTGQALFPTLHAETEETVMQGAYRLYKHLGRDRSPGALRKRELIDRMLARATGKANPTRA